MHNRFARNASELFKEWFHNVFVPEVHNILTEKHSEDNFIARQCQFPLHQ